MLKKGLSVLLSTAVVSSSFVALIPQTTAMAATNRQTRVVEYLDRGLVAVRVDGGVYLSWRWLGTEADDTTYDIYRNGTKIVSGLNNTNYTDDEGFESDVYQVVVSGQSIDNEKESTVWSSNCFEIPIDRPTPDPANTKAGTSYTYSANDASVADVDGDGEYEIILKWDPSNSKDNMYAGYTGNVYIDAYEMDGTKLWRIDMGMNIRAGAHYTQFIVYDFDGDGKAEMALRTAPGSKDSKGNYVTEKGSGLIAYDNTKDYRDSNGHPVSAPDYLTMFNGETGEAMKTIDYYVQRGSKGDWGSSDIGNYSDRFLAGMAYLDGVHPSLLMCRGYYFRASMAAYNWNGSDFELVWMRDDASGGMASQGAHSLSVADMDNDGYDEVIYGSCVVDHDGTILNRTGHGHGDALHVSDFNNDGYQEVFSTHEGQSANWGAELRKWDGTVIKAIGRSEDVGRGVMGNVIGSKSYSEFWSVADGNMYNDAGKKILGGRISEMNFLSWWDGDLTREILDKNRIVKYDIVDDALTSERLLTMAGVHSNNSTKATPSLSADILGDWREEVIMPSSDDRKLKVYTTTIPTEHKMPTLMHDTQYRCAIAWQNVGYNQPPHPSFYVGEEIQEYPAPDVKFAAVPSGDTVVTTPDEELVTVIATETFDSPDMSVWPGTVTTDIAPYKNVLSLTGTQTKELTYSDDTQAVSLNFLYKPSGTGSAIKVLDENGKNIITFTKPDGSITYTAGNGTAKTVDSAMSKNDWYSISLTVDTVAKLVNFTVKDYSVVGGTSKTIYGASFADNGGTRVASIQTVNGCYIDNVSFSEIKYNVPMALLTLNILNNGSPLEGADVTLNGITLTTASDGKVVMMLKDNCEYDITVTKPEYKTYKGTVALNGAVTENVNVENGVQNEIYVQYKDADGNDLKAQEIAGTALDNTTYQVSDESLADIEADGVIYEFDPDATSNTTVTVDGPTSIDLVYKVKTTPVEADINPVRINFGKNAIGKAYWTSEIEPEYLTTDYDVNYGLFGNVGTKDITVNLPQKLGKSYIIEYDMVVSNIDDGNIFSMVPYSGTTAGTPIGIYSDSGDLSLVAGSSTSSPKYITYTSAEYRSADYVKGYLMHVTIIGNNSEMRVTHTNRDLNTVFAKNVSYTITSSVGTTAGIDKLVFKRVSGSGNCSVGLAELKAYTIGGPTSASYIYGETVTMAIPQEKSLAPTSCIHEVDFGGVSADLTAGLSYELVDSNGNAVTNGLVTLNSSTGLLSVGDGAASGEYTANLKFNGNTFKTVPVTVTDQERENFWTEDFEGDTHKFTKTSGTDYHQADKATQNAASGLIYAVGADSGSQSSEIDISKYEDVAIDLNFRLDGCSDTKSSYVSLIGAANNSKSLSSSTPQILTIKAYASGNGYWNSITVNGQKLSGANIHNGTSNPESGAIDLKRDTTGWLHLYALPDFDRQKVVVYITRVSNGNVIYSGELDFVNQCDTLKRIYISDGAGYGATYIDDIAISGFDSTLINDTREVSSITVTAPGKTTYFTGDSLDTTGMKITASYTDGTSGEVTRGYTIAGFDSTVPGVQTVTVTYKGVSQSFEVTVYELKTIYAEDFEGETHSFTPVSSGYASYVYHMNDKATVNTASGMIFGVGSRKDGYTGANSEKFDCTGYENIRAELDFRLDAPKETKSQSISLMSGYNKENTVLSGSNQILTITSTASGNGYIGSVTLNGIDITSGAEVSNGTSNGENAGTAYSSSAGGTIFNSLNRDTTGWLHLTAYPDFETKTIDVTLTRKSNGVVIYSGTVDFLEDAQSLGSIFLCSGNEYGAAWVDNIMVRGTTEAVEPTPTPESAAALLTVTDTTLVNDNGTISGDINAIVTAGSEIPGTNVRIYTAIYSDDRLLSVLSEDMELTEGDNEIAINDISIEAEGGEFDVRMFVWEDMRPVTNTVKAVIPEPTEEPTPEPEETEEPSLSVAYRLDYNNASGGILTSNNTDRYITELVTEDGNTYEKVSVVGDGNNGAYITTEAFTVSEGVDFEITFDMALTPTCSNSGTTNYAQCSYFVLRSMADDCSAMTSYDIDGDYIFRLTQAQANIKNTDNTVFYINDNTEDTVTLGVNEWYIYKIELIANVPYLTINDAEGNAVVERKEIAKKTENGGLNGIYYATKRYKAGMSIDNVVVQEF